MAVSPSGRNEIKRIYLIPEEVLIFNLGNISFLSVPACGIIHLKEVIIVLILTLGYVYWF